MVDAGTRRPRSVGDLTDAAFFLDPAAAMGLAERCIACVRRNNRAECEHLSKRAHLGTMDLQIGDNASIGDGAIIYSLGSIYIGDDATVSQYAHLCAGTHDFRDASMTLLKQSISVGNGAWVCADAFVGPGVTVGSMAVVGACAVVVRNVDDNKVVVGNPARVVGDRWGAELISAEQSNESVCAYSGTQRGA